MASGGAPVRLEICSRGPPDHSCDVGRKCAVDHRSADAEEEQSAACPHQEGWKPADLPRILAEHGRWLERQSTGEDFSSQGRANLCNANLIQAKLNNAILSGAKLNNANLVQAKLNNANLWDAELNNANLFLAELNNAFLGGPAE